MNKYITRVHQIFACIQIHVQTCHTIMTHTHCITYPPRNTTPHRITLHYITLHYVTYIHTYNHTDTPCIHGRMQTCNAYTLTYMYGYLYMHTLHTRMNAYMHYIPYTQKHTCPQTSNYNTDLHESKHTTHIDASHSHITSTHATLHDMT